ncbi:beta-lactamase family protein [Pseudoalteromonas sp. SMS1]|uniref:serine hydrolase domain-containing protein n=1 Tax=Pseudoalteromonas sp. SMS1 TaxID=2908894 RepID=UPI001F378AD2|nr:serine hydrolase domain-containing protein [Pseudoalteromonas sp. SMS1]MCF2859984.1 beta-lactamase family protein [Pseudoalteromonas sp. SMS1]
MFRIIVQSLLCLITLSGCGFGDARSDSEKLTDLLAQHAEQHNIPAQGLLVLHQDKEVFKAVYSSELFQAEHQLTKDSLFPIYSISKLFASVLILQFAEEQQIALDQPASLYVRGLPSAWQNISINDFLNHASGIPEYFDRAPRHFAFASNKKDVFAKLQAKPVHFSSGTKIRYTQTNYLVLAAILESVSGLSYERLVEQRILTPLGMKNTLRLKQAQNNRDVVKAYDVSGGKLVEIEPILWPDYSVVHGGYHSNLEDIGRFLSSVTTGKLIAQSQLQHYFQPYRLRDGNIGYFASGWDYARNSRIQELGHDGGTLSRVRVVYKNKLNDAHIIVYFTNGNSDGVWSRDLVDAVQASLSL